MRLYTAIRNDQEPQKIKAEKFKSDGKDYIFSSYNPDNGYDIVIAVVPVDKVVEIFSEEIEAPKRLYRVTRLDGTAMEVRAECTKIMDSEVVFMNYEGDYTQYTTVTKVSANEVAKIDVVS